MPEGSTPADVAAAIGPGLAKAALAARVNGELRDLAHVLDSLPFYIGWLWPLWDTKRQTFADKVVKTVVVTVPK